jgi:hypothetical protein
MQISQVSLFQKYIQRKKTSLGFDGVCIIGIHEVRAIKGT